MPLKDQESIGKAFTIETSQKTCRFHYLIQGFRVKGDGVDSTDFILLLTSVNCRI